MAVHVVLMSLAWGHATPGMFVAVTRSPMRGRPALGMTWQCVVTKVPNAAACGVTKVPSAGTS